MFHIRSAGQHIEQAMRASLQGAIDWPQSERRRARFHAIIEAYFMSRRTIALEIKYRTEYFIFRTLIALVRLLPLDTAVAMSATALRVVAARGRRQKRALDNLKRAFPELSDREREQIAMRMWENLGRVAAETLHQDQILNEPERFEVKNQHILDRYRAKPGAQIYLSLHTGNWELGIAPVTWSGYHPAAVYRLIKNPYVDQHVRNSRTRLYPGGFFAKGNKRELENTGHPTVRQIGKHIRDGGRLAIVADLFDDQGILVPFFGHPAKSTPYPAMLARQTGCRLWVGRCIRLGTGSRFQIECFELKVHRSNDKSADVKRITADIQKQFENWIREYPEQWAWYNRKWS